MKKFMQTLFRILASLSIISWAYFSQHHCTQKVEKHQSITWEKQKQKSDFPPRFLSWSKVIITKDNAHDIVIKSWEDLLYRNEVYGFEVLFGKERGSPLWIQQESDPMDGQRIRIYLQNQTNHHLGEEDKPIENWEKNQYLGSLDITIRTPQEFEKRIHDPNLFVWSIPYADAELWRNQKWVFSSRQYWFTRQYRFDLIPWLKKHCTYDKDRECGNRLRDVMFTGFSTFDIE